MRLKNKSTGDLGNLCYEDGVFMVRTDAGCWQDFSSLEKLTEEWKDYEEVKEYWFIDDTSSIGINNGLDKARKMENFDKSIGNYFETKEEAEKAVEKLKAWKRLKELGFRFIGKTCEYKSDKHFGSVFFEISGEILDVYKDNVDFYDDLDLLFG